jgi:hypothetical protein
MGHLALNNNHSLIESFQINSVLSFNFDKPVHYLYFIQTTVLGRRLCVYVYTYLWLGHQYMSTPFTVDLSFIKSQTHTSLM